MAPIRRYLRITKYSVLEVRVYLENPATAESWLLRRHDPALPRIIAAVQPLVLPKLREENERAKGKSKKKGVKDVIVQAGHLLTPTRTDDFEVSIFLTEHSSRHTLLTKQKNVGKKGKLQSNSSRLTEWVTRGPKEQPEQRLATEPDVVVLEEDDEGAGLGNIPDTPNVAEEAPAAAESPDNEGESASKKPSINTQYDGFSIYGRILCLVVKRRGQKAQEFGSSQQMLETWVSTQAAQETLVDDEDG
ncbi:hypothetical protein P152DRAFT_386683 [Eremomyces bilateralis CBS 781.70]|uniref:Uncharacterized protein n=1 Tax=Eremomyces bilateralis CBS 781.70 TaxID=1392243 RepID=A0A6G1GH51_9PEZI|nr:uncharacterized protein P152DRAFT_386683 [Eremomyces bilateralis CBS 781.70]KAF1817398.1 hypothetical protein P152DRAFT_386683 [Eremomyces bilateralis CBS 781.70]